MPTRRKATKKKAAKRSGGIAGFIRRIANTPAVKKAAKKVTELEKKLAAAKKVKAAAKKKACKACTTKRKK